jgi:hypothetical protein
MWLVKISTPARLRADAVGYGGSTASSMHHDSDLDLGGYCIESYSPNTHNEDIYMH